MYSRHAAAMARLPEQRGSLKQDSASLVARRSEKGPGVREQLSGRGIRLRQVVFPCRAFGSVDLTEVGASFLMITMSRSKRARLHVRVCARLSVRHLHASSPQSGSDRRNGRPLLTSLVSDTAEPSRSPPLKPHGRASSRTGGAGHIPSGSRAGYPRRLSGSSRPNHIQRCQRTQARLRAEHRPVTCRAHGQHADGSSGSAGELAVHSRVLTGVLSVMPRRAEPMSGVPSVRSWATSCARSTLELHRVLLASANR